MKAASRHICSDLSLLLLRRSNLRLHTADAADYVLNLADQVHKGLADPLDIVFIDAFDGNDDVPDCFCDPGKGHTQQMHNNSEFFFSECYVLL